MTREKGRSQLVNTLGNWWETGATAGQKGKGLKSLTKVNNVHWTWNTVVKCNL